MKMPGQLLLQRPFHKISVTEMMLEIIQNNDSSSFDCIKKKYNSTSLEMSLFLKHQKKEKKMTCFLIMDCQPIQWSSEIKKHWSQNLKFGGDERGIIINNVNNN